MMSGGTSARFGRTGILSLAALLAACSQAPDYRPPAVAAAPAFKEAAGWAAANPRDDAPRGPWWEAFGDPVLNDLEARAEAASPSVAAALARYEQAAAFSRRTRAERLPVVTGGGQVQRERYSGNRPFGTGDARTYTDKIATVGLDWEIDLWGRLGDAARAGRAESQASGADLAAARLSLHAMIADTYFRLRGLDAEAELLRQTTEAYARAAELTDTRHEGGIASGLDTNRAHTQLADARAQLSTVALDRANAEHALAALVGETASSFTIAPATPRIEPPAIPTGAPGQLLERRPDIAAAERRMAAANARIGVAKAAWFPSVTLGASGGFEATGGDFLSATNRVWALGPLALVQTLFDGGRRAADVARARAEFDETAANYRETVLGGFREVEDGLAAARYLAVASQDQQEAAAAADYLEVVVAQTAALVAERAALVIHTQRLQAAVAVVRALGGGFQAADVQAVSGQAAGLTYMAASRRLAYR
jgi:multidrug efflux system outer membrane protein